MAGGQEFNSPGLAGRKREWGLRYETTRLSAVRCGGCGQLFRSHGRPRLGRAADAKVLRFVPQADLANLDPIWTTLYVVRNASVLFFDTLYGVDSTLTPKPQCALAAT